MADTAARSWARRMAPQRRDAVLARLTEAARRHGESADALIAAVAALLDASEAGEAGRAIYAEVGTKGRIHVKTLRPD